MKKKLGEMLDHLTRPKCSLLVFMVDDYTNIHTRHRPTTKVPLSVSQKATLLLKRYNDIPALPVLRGCGHSYHFSCIAVSGICIICFSALETAIKELVKTANYAIFNPRWKNEDNKDDTDSTATPSNDDNEDLCGQVKVKGR